MSNCSASCTSVRSPLIAAIATFALKADAWFRRGLLLMLSPGSRAKSCPLSGKSSTYRPVQILEAGSLSDLESHQLQRLETRVAVLADDEVVVHGDAQRARDLDDCARHVDVGARGSGIARGMVVHEPVIPPNILNFRNSPWPK